MLKKLPALHRPWRVTTYMGDDGVLRPAVIGRGGVLIAEVMVGFGFEFAMQVAHIIAAAPVALHAATELVDPNHTNLAVPRSRAKSALKQAEVGD